MSHKFFWFILFVLAGNAHAETLLEVYQQAEAGAPSLKIADAERQAIAERKPQARAQLLPNVALNGNLSGQTGQGRASDATAMGYTVSLSYPLYQRDASIQLEQAEKQIEQAEINYQSAQQDLISQVVERYFNVLATQDNLEFARTDKEAIQRHLEQSRQRFEVGLIAITDVQESQARYDLATAQEISAENELYSAREMLREVTGQENEQLASLNQEVELLPPQPADIQQWAEGALEQNPTLLKAQYDAEIAAREIHRQRAGRLPTVSLVGQHSYSDSDTDSAFTSGYSHVNSVGVQVNMPLYVGGAVKSRTREAKIRHQQALDTIELQRRLITRQVNDAYRGILAGISRVKALKQAVLSSQTAYEATRTGFDVGTRTAVEVLDSQRDLLAARRDHARARYDYVLNTLRLKQAAGILAMSDLEALEGWFE